MKKYNSLRELNAHLEALELTQKSEMIVLKLEILESIETFNPLTKIKDFAKDFLHSEAGSEDLKKSMLSMIVGSITNQLVVGKSGNPIKQIAGSFLQHGVTNLVFNNADFLKVHYVKLYEKINGTD